MKVDSPDLKKLPPLLFLVLPVEGPGPVVEGVVVAVVDERGHVVAPAAEQLLEGQLEGGGARAGEAAADQDDVVLAYHRGWNDSG